MIRWILLVALALLAAGIALTEEYRAERWVSAL